MNKNFLMIVFFSFCPILSFAADNLKLYQESVAHWGVSPLAKQLYRKTKDDQMSIDDVRSILKEGTFGSDMSICGLKKISEGNTSSTSVYTAKFFEKKYYFVYTSRTLGRNGIIPDTASLTRLKKTILDKTSKIYEYQLSISPDKIYQFILSWQKVDKLTEKKKQTLKHEKMLFAKVDLQRPASVQYDLLPQDLEAEIKKAENIEKFVERSKDKSKITSKEESKDKLGLPLLLRQKSLPALTPKLLKRDEGMVLPDLSKSGDSPKKGDDRSRLVVDSTEFYGSKEKKNFGKSINPPAKLNKLERANSLAIIKEHKKLAEQVKKSQKKKAKSKND